MLRRLTCAFSKLNRQQSILRSTVSRGFASDIIKDKEMAEEKIFVMQEEGKNDKSRRTEDWQGGRSEMTCLRMILRRFWRIRGIWRWDIRK